MNYCPYCSVELSDRAIFCSECGKTIRCRECKDVLGVKAKFCISCGTSVHSISEAASGDVTQAGEQKYNIIEYKEDTRSRHFKAQVTDHAVDAMGGHLSLLMSRTLGTKSQRSERHPLDGSQPSQSDLFDSALDGDPAVNDAFEIGSPVGENQPAPRAAIAPSTDVEHIKRIFQRNSDDKFMLMNPWLKAKNQRDHAARLSVLFIYANELEGRDTVQHSEIVVQLKSAKVWDSNANRWLKRNDFMRIDDDQIRLTIPGRDFAKLILREIEDPNIESKWSLGSKPATRSKRTGNTDSTKATGVENGNDSRRRQRGIGVVSQVRELFAEHFFSTSQSADAVEEALVTRGHRFERRRIRSALVNLTKKKLLRRKKSEQGDWVYEAFK